MKNVRKIMLFVVLIIVSSHLNAQESKGKGEDKPVNSLPNKEISEKTEDTDANLLKRSTKEKRSLGEQVPMKRQPKKIVLEEQTLLEQDEKALVSPEATEVEPQEKPGIEKEKEIILNQSTQIEAKENKAIKKGAVVKKSKLKRFGSAKKRSKKMVLKSKKIRFTKSAGTGVKKSKPTLK